MSEICCAPGCKNAATSSSGVTFYKFPGDKALRAKWISAINKGSDWVPDKNDAVCSGHFATGQKHDQDWHPDYVPSVFRTMRREIKKPKWQSFDEQQDQSREKEKKLRKQLLQEQLKRVGKQSGVSESSTPKAGPRLLHSGSVKELKRLGRPIKGFRDPSLSTPTRKTDKVRLRDTISERKVWKRGRKRKKDDSAILRDFAQRYEVVPILKNLSVVLERTSESEIKDTLGEDIVIKEEPPSDEEYQGELEYASTMDCSNCEVLEQKLSRLEQNLKRASGGAARCKQCATLRSKLHMALARQPDGSGKCTNCSVSETKSKRLENQLKRSRTEVAELQNKLASIEISEQAFKKFKSKVKLYTGLPNYETLSTLYDHLKPSLPSTGVKGLGTFQMFALVLMRLKLNLPIWDLTYRFGAPPNTIQEYYKPYVDILESELSHAILWPKANLSYRLQVLASNLRQSYGMIKTNVDVDTLMVPSSPLMSEEDKTTRVCAALYHIAQLVSSNHSQQLLRILRSKDDTDRLQPEKNKDNAEQNESLEPRDEELMRKSKALADAHASGEVVDDSDIFLEDLTKEVAKGNSIESLELECENLQKEIDTLTDKLNSQFKFYTGLRSYEIFNNLLGFLENQVLHISKEKLTYFRQLQLVLMRLRLNLDVQDLSYLFAVSSDHIVYLTRQWVDVMSKQLSNYIDWPGGLEDEEGEKRLLGTVKIKYQILWGPRHSPRNRKTGREREKIEFRKLIRACSALYNIDDIEVFKNGEKESLADKRAQMKAKGRSTPALEDECRKLREELYGLRKVAIQNYTKPLLNESALSNDDAMVKYYTGFSSAKVCRRVFDLVVPIEKQDARRTSSPFQQFMTVLLRLKLNLSTQDLGFRLGMGNSNAHRLIQDWLGLLHLQLAPYITWPDDEEDVQVFTDTLRKTYAYLRDTGPNKKKKKSRPIDTGLYDIETLVCAGLFNAGETSYADNSDSECDSQDEDWQQL